MLTILLRTALLATLVAILAAFSGALGLGSVWPVLLAAAVGLAAAPSAGRLIALVIGAGTGWAAFALRAGYLPDIAAGRAIAAATAVIVVGIVAGVTRDHLPLWAGLVGIAVFDGLYEPLYAANPAAFLTDSVVALTQALLALGIGMAAAYVFDGFSVGEAAIREEVTT